MEIRGSKRVLLGALLVLLGGTAIALITIRLMTGSFIPLKVLMFFVQGSGNFWENIRWVFAHRNGLLGLLLDQEFGLIPNAPIYLLVFVGLPLALRENWEATVMMLVLFLGYYLSVASIRQWHGAWSPPSRYIVAIVPLLGLLIAYAAKYHAGRFYTWVKGGLFGVSLWVSFWYALAPSWRYNEINGSNKLLKNLSAWLPVDMTVFLPSYVDLSQTTFILSLPWAILALSLTIYYYTKRTREVAVVDH